MTTQSLKLDHALQFVMPPMVDGKPGKLPSVEWGLVPSKTLAATENPVNTTLGWDTVFAVPVTKVNQHFAQSNLYPKDFTGSYSGKLFTVTISGNFGPWTIALGGSGALINLSIPVASGTMKATSNYDLQGATLVVQVRLNYLPQPSQGTKGTPNQLKVADKPFRPGDPAALVVDLTIPNQTDPTVINAAIGAFQDFFDKNLARITHVFNTVNLNAVADQAAFQWLKPTTTNYAYFDAPSLDRAVFGVLCMVNNNSSGTNSNEIAAGAIPTRSGITTDSGFSLNSQLFMREMVLPAMAASFSANNKNAKIDQSYFKIQHNDTEIVNAKNIPLATVVYGKIPYKPECTSLRVTLQANELVVYTKFHVNISAGIDAYTEQTSYFTPGLKTGSDGKQYLDFEKAGASDPHSWSELSGGVEITDILIGIIGAVIGIIVGAVGQTLGYIIAGILIAITAGILAAVPFLIELVQANGVIGNIPPISDLVVSATNDIQWSGGQTFNLGFVQLNGTLQMAGTAFPS
jgi:Clostridium P-47 protein